MTGQNQILDGISQARLKDVYPGLAAKIWELAMALPFPIRITQGLRTWEQQADLYALGRTKPGNKVTNAEPGSPIS